MDNFIKKKLTDFTKEKEKYQKDNELLNDKIKELENRLQVLEQGAEVQKQTNEKVITDYVAYLDEDQIKEFTYILIKNLEAKGIKRVEEVKISFN